MAATAAFPHLVTASSPVPDSPSLSRSPSLPLSPSSIGSANSSTADLVHPNSAVRSKQHILVLAITIPFSNDLNESDFAHYVGTGMLFACLPPIFLTRSKSRSTSALEIEIDLGNSDASQAAIRTLIENGREDGAKASVSFTSRVRIVVSPLVLEHGNTGDKTAEHEGGEGEITAEETGEGVGLQPGTEARLRVYYNHLVRRSIAKGGVNTISEEEQDLDIDVLLFDNIMRRATLPTANSALGNKRDTAIRSARLKCSRVSSTVGPGWVLVAKIAGAAAELGYSLQAVRNVARLVMRHVGSASIDTGPNLTAQDPRMTSEGKYGGLDLKVQVEATLARLLKSGGAETVVVNSNEPVLLLDTWGDRPCTATEMDALIFQTVDLLRADYGIRPVRVYASEFWSQSAETGGERGFSISILNVVNTELGGPSMIQLLDEPSGAVGWDTKVEKEGWEGSDGSVLSTVQLALKNWSTRNSALRDREFQGPRGTKEEPGPGKTNDQQGSTGGKPDSVRSEFGKEQQEVTVEEAVEKASASTERTSSAMSKDEDQKEKRPELESTEAGARDQNVLSGTDSSTVDETKHGINTMDEEILAQKKAIELDRKVASDQEVAEEENAETSQATDQIEPSHSAEGDFEMVEHEPTLIDMILGPRKRE